MLRTLLFVCLLPACAGPGPDPTRIQNQHDGLWQEVSPAAVELVLEQTYGREDGVDAEILGTPRYLASDPDGNLYLVDGSRIVSFAPDGALRWTIDQEGEGPGEVYRPRGLVFGPDGLLYLSNQSGTRLDRFRPDGAFVDILPLAQVGLESGTLIGFVAPAIGVFTGSVRTRFATVFRLITIGDEMALTDTVRVDFTGDIEIPGSISVTGSSGVFDGRIVTSLIAEYGYAVLDRNLDEVYQTRRDEIPFLAPYVFQRGGRSGVMVMSLDRSPVGLSDGRWLGGARWPVGLGDLEVYAAERFAGSDFRPENNQTLDLFSAAGRLLYSWDTEALEDLEISSVEASNLDNHIYARMTADSPTIGRYRLVIAEPQN